MKQHILAQAIIGYNINERRGINPLRSPASGTLVATSVLFF
jgi:hypothetical protein